MANKGRIYYSYKRKVAYSLEEHVRKESIREEEDLRRKLATDTFRLGEFTNNGWEHGYEQKKLQEKSEELEKELEKKTKRFERRQHTQMLEPDDSSSNSSDSDSPAELDQYAEYQRIRLQLTKVKLELAKLDERKEALRIETEDHKRALIMVAREECSDFSRGEKVSDASFSCLFYLISFLVSCCSVQILFCSAQ